MRLVAPPIAAFVALIALNPLLVHAAKELAEILQLRAEPDFRSVKLYWEYPKHGADFYGFQIHYCELQAWGPNRCRTKIIDESSGIESVTGKKFRMYSVIINSLRLATNYSFEVRPLQVRHGNQPTKDLGKNIVVPTKGFSARASLCLPDVSEVEVSTGPFFGGRIAVESSDGSKSDNCSIGGDATSPKDTYILRIEHKTCGSAVNRTSVSTFILVQETLPILTHSTRRFVVLCTFQPETLTVRAGINLPFTGMASATTGQPLRNEMANEILGNDVQPASLVQASEAVNHSRSFKGRNESHFFLITVLLMSSIIGVVLTIWWMMPLRRNISLNRSSNLSIFSSEAGSASMYENYTNSIRDTTSITDIDFGDILADEDGYKNEVFNPTMTEFRIVTEPGSNGQILNVCIEEPSQSEA